MAGNWNSVEDLAGCHDAKGSWEKIEAEDGNKERGGCRNPRLDKDNSKCLKHIEIVLE